jgi:hypothetical protein
MVRLNTGVMFLLFTCVHFGGGKFYEGGPRVRLPPMKWSVTAESSRNTVLGLVAFSSSQSVSYVAYPDYNQSTNKPISRRNYLYDEVNFFRELGLHTAFHDEVFLGNSTPFCLMPADGAVICLHFSLLELKGVV